MRALTLLAGLILSLAIASGSAYSAPLTSFLPKTNLAQFIVDKLDIASFGSFLGPRLMPSQHTFSGMNLKPTEITPNRIVFENDDLSLVIDILARGDFNNDGLEDVVVCWSDQAPGGTYRSTTPMLLTRYSVDSPLVAIARNPPDERSCEPDPPLSKR